MSTAARWITATVIALMVGALPPLLDMPDDLGAEQASADNVLDAQRDARMAQLRSEP